MSVFYVFLVIIIAVYIFDFQDKKAVDIKSIATYALTYAAAFELLLTVFFNFGWRYVWKLIPRLNKWIFPDINGTWEAKIEWVWNNPNSKSSEPVKKGITISTINIKKAKQCALIAISFFFKQSGLMHPAEIEYYQDIKELINKM